MNDAGIKLSKIPQSKVLELFGISRNMLLRLRKEGKLRTYSLPGSYKIYFDLKELEALFELQQA